MGIAKSAVVSAMRRLPMPLARPLVRRRVRRMQADPVTRRVALAEMEFLLGAAVPDADLESAADRHVERRAWRAELRWRPREVARQQVSGIDNFTKVRGPQGGLVMCFLHHGHYDAAWIPLKAAGMPPLTGVVHPRFFDDDIPPYIKQHMALIEVAATPVPATLGFKGLKALLEEGATLGIAIDVPGTTEVSFLGRRLAVSSGAAGLAMVTGSPVVLVTAHPSDDHVQEVRISEPLLPADFADADALLQAVFDLAAPAVLAWPEAYDWPRSKYALLDAEGQVVPHVRQPGEPAV